MDQKTSVQLPIRFHPGVVNPVRLLLRSGRSLRPFLPHIKETWARLMHPAVGGPARIALFQRPAPRIRARRRGRRSGR
jgi:hypothetical protein